MVISKVLAEMIAFTVQENGKVLICGNGGLAAESEHFAAELMGKFGSDIYIPCIALTANTSLLSALANDIGWENVFSHQVEVLGKGDDLLIGMTTTHSANILKAIETATRLGMISYLLDGDKLEGNTVAEKQNYAISLLHEAALEAKKLCS